MIKHSRTACRLATVLARSLIAVSLATAASAATTWVVDDDGGADFTDIPAAIAAANPGDTILVMAGAYSPFTLSEGVSIIGYTASVAGTMTVSNLPGGRRATLSGLNATKLVVINCTAKVLLDELTISGNPAGLYSSVAISNDVRFRHCSIGNASGSGLGSSTGMTIDASRVEITSSTVGGDNGAHGGFCEDGDDGSPGIVCTGGADLHLSRTTVLGGDGGDGGVSCLFFPSGGDGAVALDFTDTGSLLVTGTSADTISGGDGGYAELLVDSGNPEYALDVQTGNTARISGATFVGGFDPFFGGNFPGIHNSGGTVDEVVPDDPSLDTTGTTSPGNIVTLVLRGPVGSSARIRLGRAPRVVDLPGVYEDRLLAPLRTFSLGGVPPSGEVSFPFGIGDLWPAGTLIMAQGSCTIGADTTLSQSVPLIVR